MTEREVIVPPTMTRIYEEYGYAPALRVGDLVYCAGQVGRTADLQVILDPEAQFEACWENLRVVLAAADCAFEDVVDLTTYHVDLAQHFDAFKRVKNRVFPRRTCPWTAIGVQALSRPGLLLEIKCVALRPGGRP
ncbi:MAG: RidA family protein [Alphaproteobacteria bacterium]|nr:RidA family protein [Alphaproteobacteria bacterium]